MTLNKHDTSGNGKLHHLLIYCITAVNRETETDTERKQQRDRQTDNRLSSGLHSETNKLGRKNKQKNDWHFIPTLSEVAA